MRACVRVCCAAGLTLPRDNRLLHSLGMEAGGQGWGSLLVESEVRAGYVTCLFAAHMFFLAYPATQISH